MFLRNRKTSKKEMEKVKMLINQYELLQNAWSENAMLFHDMDNHMQTIYHLAGEGKNEEIKQYITRISKPIKQLSGIRWTGMGIVDAVLNTKKMQAGEKGYEMDINAQLPANTGIAQEDFCTILTNLIDNAIESVDREKNLSKKPVIQVSLRHIHHFLVIRITNPCSRQLRGKWRIFNTSKEDRLLHGWGLKNVRRAVWKYNGSFSCEITENRFAATVMMFFK